MKTCKAKITFEIEVTGMAETRRLSRHIFNTFRFLKKEPEVIKIMENEDA